MLVQTLGAKSGQDFPCKPRHVAKYSDTREKEGKKTQEKSQEPEPELVSAGVTWKTRIHHPRPHTSFGENTPCCFRTTSKSPTPAAEQLPTPGWGVTQHCWPPRRFPSRQAAILSPHLAKSSTLQLKNPADFFPALPAPASLASANSPCSQNSTKSLQRSGLQPPPCAWRCPRAGNIFPNWRALRLVHSPSPGNGKAEQEQLLHDSGTSLFLCNPDLYSQLFVFLRNMTKRRNISF